MRPRAIPPILLLLVVLGLVRLVYLLWFREDLPFWDVPIADASVYHEAARSMAAGDWLDPSFSYRTFLYPLWLGGIYSLAGDSTTTPIVIQSLLGLGSVGLVYRIGSREWGPVAGLVAASGMGLYGPLVATETKLLDTSLTLFLHTASLAALLGARGSRRWVLAGVLLGLAGLGRPPLWLFAGAALLWTWRSSRRAALWCGVGVAMVVLAGSSWNYAASGSFTPLSRNGGVTFLAGNNAGARGDYRPPPGFSGEATAQEAEHSRRGRSGWAAGFQWLREHPLDAARLVALKLYRFGLADEAPLEYDYATEREAVALLYFLPVPFSLLLVAGLLGLYFRRDRTAVLLGGAVGVQLATALIFFVASRYRILAVPSLALLSGALFVVLRERWRGDGRRMVAAVAIAGGVAVLALSFNPLDEEADRKAVASYNIATAWRLRGDLGRARRHYRAAALANPRMSETWLELGNLAAQGGRYHNARQHYRRALVLHPGYVRAQVNLAILALRQRPPATDRALTWLARARGLAPGDREVAFQLGNAHKAAGNLGQACRAFERSIRLDPLRAAAWNNLGTTRWALAQRRQPTDWPLMVLAADALGQAVWLGSAAAHQNLRLMWRRYGRRSPAGRNPG